MLKLTKYEFRKNRSVLLIIAVGFLLLQGYFLVSLFLEKETHSGMSASLLTLYSVVCFFAVFILAITNYSKELNSKTSYLIFMTPTTPLSIIFSKLLNILIIGIIIVLVFFGIGMLDLKLLMDTYPEVGSFAAFIDEIFEVIGVDSTLFFTQVGFYIVSFLISFFSTVTLIYFAITLSATLLQNNRFRGFVSFILFIGFTILTGYISDKLPVLCASPANSWDIMLNLIPDTILELIVMIVSILGCSVLLEKKVSL